MIIDYDTNPALDVDQKLRSLIESIQLALNEAMFDAGVSSSSGSSSSSEGEGSDFTPSWCYVNAVVSTSITAAETPTKIPIDSILRSSSDITYDNTEKGIVIGTSGLYVFSVQAGCTTATDGDLMGIQIYSNGAHSIGPEYNRTGGGNDRVVLLPTIVPVNAGDVFTLYGRNNSSGRGTFNSCRFAVFRIE